jgi:hydroxymethylpyrimidine pyrophosphatase-like HAD family hydrolase
MRYVVLVSDYDETLALNGQASPAALDALERTRASGRRTVLVTGRELPELESVFPHLSSFDAVVAENGGLLYWPREGREEVLGEPPPQRLLAEFARLQVSPLSVGRVICATRQPAETAVLEAIRTVGIEYHVVFNKGAVMVLPGGINKASGVEAALGRLGLPRQQAIGIGDAENDQAFLDMCGVAVAVSNALPAVKERCDLVTSGAAGDGVVELIERLLSDDLQSLGLRRPRKDTALHS